MSSRTSEIEKGEGVVLTVRQGVDLRCLLLVPVDPAEAGEGVYSIDVHGARSTDSLTARPTEGQSRIDLVLDLDQGVED